MMTTEYYHKRESVPSQGIVLCNQTLSRNYGDL